MASGCHGEAQKSVVRSNRVCDLDVFLSRTCLQKQMTPTLTTVAQLSKSLGQCALAFDICKDGKTTLPKLQAIDVSLMSR